MKLNLGSNDVRYEGFVNLDIRNIPNVDIVDDVTKLIKIKNNSVEEIIAHAILEHIAFDKTIDTLTLWVNKLEKGGVIEIGVPDGELIFERYKRGKVTRKEYINNPWMDVIHSMFGNMKIMRDMHGDDAEKYMHHILFCEEYLKKCMEEVGLKSIQKLRPEEVHSPAHPDCMYLKGIKK